MSICEIDKKRYKQLISLQLAAILAYADLRVVQFYFDTATYDEIGRDVKVIIRHIHHLVFINDEMKKFQLHLF